MKSKIKNLLFASFMVIPISFASCNKGGGGEEKCTHEWSDYTYVDETYHHRVCEKCHEEEKLEHVFTNPTVVTEPTCSTEGMKVSTCAFCKHEKYESIPATGVHKYDQNIVLPNNENLKEWATCDHPDIYYKTCACGKFIESEDSPTFESGEALPHQFTSLFTKGLLEKKEYVTFEQFDPKGLIFKAHCDTCSKDVTIDVKDITFTYPSGADSFRFGDTSVIANYKDLSCQITGLTIRKAQNEIYGLEDQDILCGEKVTFAPYAKFDKEAKITTEVKDKDGKVIDPKVANAFNASGSPYTATATLEGTDDYEGATTTCAIKVSHAAKEWISDKFYDRLVCPKCGEVERTFRTQLDANFDFDSTDSATLDFESLKLSSDPSIKYKVFDDGGGEVSLVKFERSAYFPVLPASASVDEIKKNYKAVEENGKVHNLTISLNVVNHILKDEATFKTINSTTQKLVGYYIVNNDITFSGADWHTNSTWDSNVGFHAILDGRGHTVDNINVSGAGIFSYTGNAGSIKDINFTNVSLGAHINGAKSPAPTPGGFCPLLCRVNNSVFTVDHVSAQFKSVIENDYVHTGNTDGNSYLCCRTQTNNFKIFNSTFDLSQIEGGVTYALGMWHTCKRIGGDINNKVYLKSYVSLGWNNPGGDEISLSDINGKWEIFTV